MPTLIDLAKRLEKTADEISANSAKVGNEIALAIVEDLAHTTPVDTSQALSNWQVGLGQPVDHAIPPHFPGKHASTALASAHATVEAAKAVLAQRRPGQTIFISNVLPYIRALNDGSSTFAPAGFVERAVLIGRLALAKVKLING